MKLNQFKGVPIKLPEICRPNPGSMDIDLNDSNYNLKLKKN